MINRIKYHEVQHTKLKGFEGYLFQVCTCVFHWEHYFEIHKKRIQESRWKYFVQLVHNFKGSKYDDDAQLSIMKLKHWI
jgi:hypothetical protein